MVQGTPQGRLDGRLSITLYTGAGTVFWSSPSQEVAGTTVIPLSEFAGLAADHAADIDGIRVQSSGSYWDGGAYTTTKEQGFIISEVRFEETRGTALIIR